MKKLILIGGGGHCESVVDVVETEAKYEITGILDKGIAVGEKICGYPVLGGDELIPEFVSKGHEFLVTVGQMGNSGVRLKIISCIHSVQGKLATVISPKAHVSKSAVVKEGTVVHHFALVNANAVVGENCIINSHAVIEHGCDIGSNTHISTSATVNGGCKVGRNSLIGSGSVIKQTLELCDGVIVGAGAVVLDALSKSGTYVGVPAEWKAKNE